MTINVSDIEKFFKFISTLENPEAEILTYCLLDAESKAVIPGYGVKFGVLRDILECSQDFAIAATPFTLHTTLNSTKLTGRKTKDIEAVRVFCVDFDRVIDRKALKPLVEANHVQMVVESSPGKYHFYWKIDPAISLDLWHTWQLGLNQFFGGDLNMAAIGHTIRVPGVSRITKEGTEFMPSIIYIAEETPALTQAQILERFPWINEKAEEAAKGLKKSRRVVGKTVKEVVKKLDWRPGEAHNSFNKLAKEEDRNSTLFSLIYGLSADTCGAPLELEQAQILGYDFNVALQAHAKGMLGEDEVTKTVESAFERGLIAREKRKVREEAKLKRILGAEAVYTNGHIKEPVILPNAIDTNNRFEYNYSLGDLRDSPYTDYGITERVIQRFGNHLIRTGAIVYAFDRRELVWRSQKGCPTVVHDYVAEVCREVVKEPGLQEECLKDNGELSLTKLASMKQRFMSHHFLGQTVNIVLNSPHLTLKKIQTFDNTPLAFYWANGTDLLSNDVISPRPVKATDYLLRQSDVVYDSKAECPYWENFLTEVFAENDAPADMIKFLQEIFGYSLTGNIGEQSLFLHSGEGSNGKSRVLGCLRRLMGDYSTLLQSSALTKNKHSVGKEIDRIGAKIEGKRVVLIDDLDTKTQWNDGLVKSLTEKTIVSRRLYEEEKDIPNRAKFHIACNETPSVDGNSFAMFRRVSIIEYNRRFKRDAAKVEEIDTMIDKEISGIMNWAVAGLRRVLARGTIERPAEVEARIEDYCEANVGADTILPDIFEKAHYADEWHTTAECVQHANSMAPQTGYIGSIFKPEALGRELLKLGFKQERRRYKGSVKRGYCVHFCSHAEIKIKQIV